MGIIPTWRCNSNMKILVLEVRQNKNMTLVELAQKAGIGKTTINNIENGKVSPTLKEMEALAKALDVQIRDLFESDYK